MKIYKTKGIVLRSYSFYQADKILTLYTEELGKVGALVKGAGNIRHRYGVCMQQFSEGFFHLYLDRGKKGLARLIGGKTINSHYPLAKNLDSLSIAYWIIEFTNKLTPELQPSLSKYRLLESALDLLEKNSSPLFRIAYGLHFLHLAGYGLDFTCCVRCGNTEFDSGGIVDNRIVCLSCWEQRRAGKIFPAEAWSLLKKLNEQNLEAMVGASRFYYIGTPLPPVIEEWFNQYISFYLPSPLKSEKFLEKRGNDIHCGTGRPPL